MFTTKSTSENSEKLPQLLASKYNLITPEMKLRMEILIDNMKLMSRTGNRSYTLLDCYKNRFCQHFSVHSQHLACQPININEKENADNLSRLYHPKDLTINRETDDIFRKLFYSLPYEKRKKLVMICLRRLRNKKGEYDIYLTRIHACEFDALGNSWLVMIETECMHQFTPKEFYHQRHAVIVNELTNTVEEQLDVQNTNNLTHMEMVGLEEAIHQKEIVKIANGLCKDTSTIKSHRSKIMKKLNAPSIHLACIMAKSLRMM